MARPAPDRSAFLADACDGDEALRREVEELLEFEVEAEKFLTAPVASLRQVVAEPGAPAKDPQIGRRVGPYLLLELLGRGGMGDVYLARRVDDFVQLVALKFLSEEHQGGEVMRRFYVERQIQARLDHPYISRLLDGGTDENGRPYFVMDYVDGEPIDRYCESEELSVRERLVLFRKVCEAVHFAHQRLVVHRDLKPSNILVDVAGDPKLLDFGIAKLLESDHDLTRFYTRTGSQPMTLRYASPEQVREAPVSTASDVYALGVLLFKLLTGQLPNGLEDAKFFDAVRIICEEDAEHPSTVVPERQKELAGDIDALVAKTLRKEPGERYGSVEQLAEDVGRHLDGLPVLARRGTMLYLTGKFLRRHRLRVAAVAVLLGVLLGFAGYEWRRLAADRERAEKVTLFLEGLFQAADPDVRGGETLTVRQVLRRGHEQLDNLAGEPELRATLVGTLGRIHHRLGLYEEARQLTAESLAIWRRDHPGDSPELARRLSNLGALDYERGAYADAKILFNKALAVRRRLGQGEAELVKTLNNLAAVEVHKGAYADAEILYREGLEIRRRMSGSRSDAVATSLRHLGWVLYHQGELAEAAEHLEEALSIRRQSLGPRHTRVASVLHLLGSVRRAAGDPLAAEPLLREALSIRRELLGDEHIHVARTLRELAALCLDRGDSPAAVAALLEPALATLRQVKPEGDWEIADAESLYGAYLAAIGERDAAEGHLARSLRILTATRGPDALSTREALRRMEVFRKTETFQPTDQSSPPRGTAKKP